ncbi:MAG: hypothetical protein LBR80_11955 [Deltaproteobacteria bacterium]|jgi:hypothetical protein|nr:hypothetical protein [Deltaproteobacteria bacterium]
MSGQKPETQEGLQGHGGPLPSAKEGRQDPGDPSTSTPPVKTGRVPAYHPRPKNYSRFEMDLAVSVGKFESGIQAALAEIKGEINGLRGEINGLKGELRGEINGLSKSIIHVWTALAIIAAVLIAFGTILYSLNGSVKSIETWITLQASTAQSAPSLTMMPPARQAPALSAETSSRSESVNSPNGSAGTESGMGS